MEFIISYYNQAKDLTRHFVPYNPEDCDLLNEDCDASLDVSDDSVSSFSLVIESKEPEQEIGDSQFTLVALQTNTTSDTPKCELTNDQTLADASDAELGNAVKLSSSTEETLFNDQNRRTVWADDMAKIVDQYFIEEMPLGSGESSISTLETEQHSYSIDCLSKAESPESLCNTPVSEYLNFNQVSRQIYEINPYFDPILLSKHICTSYNKTLSSSKVAARYLWAVGTDTLGSCYTVGTEVCNIILGEEVSITEYAKTITDHTKSITAYAKSILKLTPEEIVLAPLLAPEIIFSETLNIAKSIVILWWNLRIKMYQIIFSAGKTLLSSSISALSNSTFPGTKLSGIRSKLSSLF